MAKTIYEQLNSFLPGVKNMDPGKAMRKKMFLNDNSTIEQKRMLLMQLECFEEIIDCALLDGGNMEAVRRQAQKRYTASVESLGNNMRYACERISLLERSYRNVNLFFANTGRQRAENVTIVNADREELLVAERTELYDLVRDELLRNYDRLDLRENYSLLVTGEYLGGNVNLDRWMKIAHESKVMLCTNFADLSDSLDVVEVFESQCHNGGELYKSNCIMCSNWIEEKGERLKMGLSPLHLSPAMALAGSLYSSLISQPSAGKRYGAICNADELVYPLKKSEVSVMESLGLVPMVKEFGRIMAFSARTLFTGDNPGLRVYSVVRVFDYISKVLIDFLNRRAFENWSSATEMELRSQIVKFLDSVSGAGRLIEKFKIVRFDRADGDKEKILLDINITPFFPAKSFLIKLDGMKDEDETKWRSDYKS
mgnify:FL=1